MNKKKQIWIYPLIALGFLSTFCSSCTKNDTVPQPVGIATDYSQVSHWLSVPAAKMVVDVFYLSPTCWQKIDSTDPNICDIDNPSMLAGALPAFERQATAFETFANVFAPYYRQADATYTLSLPEEQRQELIGGIPKLDAVAAFDYYVQHYNQGRPFILAGHSQGSNVLIHLLSGYLKDNPDVYKRMIAAYVIGYPVTAAYLANNPHLKFAEGPNDTGVIISYNTQSPGVVPPNNPVVSNIVGLVINPISWTRSETVATTNQGLGSFMPNSVTLKFEQVPQYADAKVDIKNGVLICASANSNDLYKYTKHFGMGVYHSFDYPFYFFNIRANAANRATKFLNK
ncbi:MAG: DUF3089 domain-containing protein [Peptostreptococcaceae bacterium]|nr:DUF3089 domain-containing protein [Peptostreptococcaceae bacterium]